jgi:hypothetical protein
MALPFVDRIEGRYAVLIIAGAQRRVLLRSLPQGTKEGAYLTEDLSAIAEQPSGIATAERRKRLSRDDDGGDFSL